MFVSLSTGFELLTSILRRWSTRIGLSTDNQQRVGSCAVCRQPALAVDDDMFLGESELVSDFVSNLVDFFFFMDSLAIY